MAASASTLEAERSQRRRVAALAIAAGVWYLGGEILTGVAVDSKDPTVGMLQGLTPALRGLPAAAIDPRTRHEAFLSHHALIFIVAALITSLGVLAMIAPLRYLQRAERARSPQGSPVAAIVSLYGPLLLSVFFVLYELTLAVGAHNYIIHADRTAAAVRAADAGGVREAMALIATLGQLALTVAFVLVSLRAMRVGLLTRLLGVLGILAGILFLFPLTPLPIIQTLWLVGVGAVLLEVGGRPLPPAWESGEARPWPSQQRSAPGTRSRWGLPTMRPAGAGAASAPAPLEPTAPQSPRAAKRKRKRR